MGRSIFNEHCYPEQAILVVLIVLHWYTVDINGPQMMILYYFGDLMTFHLADGGPTWSEFHRDQRSSWQGVLNVPVYVCNILSIIVSQRMTPVCPQCFGGLPDLSSSTTKTFLIYTGNLMGRLSWNWLNSFVTPRDIFHFGHMSYVSLLQSHHQAKMPTLHQHELCNIPPNLIGIMYFICT